MPVSLTTLGRPGARDCAPDVLPSTMGNASASQKFVVFEAQWLAYALPYRRFANALASACARLGADVDRYSFIVVDLHHLLLAGLPAHGLRVLTHSGRQMLSMSFSGYDPSSSLRSHAS
jgi:hypothetical protein